MYDLQHTPTLRNVHLVRETRYLWGFNNDLIASDTIGLINLVRIDSNIILRSEFNHNLFSQNILSKIRFTLTYIL